MDFLLVTVARDPAPAEPREGLPPNERMPACLSVVMFDGRGTSMRDNAIDCGVDHSAPRFYVNSGAIVPCTCEGGHNSHPINWHYGLPAGPKSLTDDPAEAKAAFERGREYVRTGEGP